MNIPLPVDQVQLLNELRPALSRLSQELAAAEAEDAVYVGGLVKSLIAVRLQILRTTHALIEQRIHAIESGAPISVVIPTTQPDEPRAQALAHEIQAQEIQLEAARLEASRYSGGLVHSLKLSTIATQEQTLAMLRQQHMIASYGLAMPSPGTCVPTAQVTPPSEPAATPPPVFEIVKVDARVTEANRTWSRYAWQLTVRNLATKPLQLQVKIEFLDAEGFVIADHVEHGLILSAGLTDKFTGNSLIMAAVAGNVRTVSAKVKAS